MKKKKKLLCWKNGNVNTGLSGEKDVNALTDLRE